MGFAASGGNATRQLAAVRGVGPRRVSSWRRRRRRDPRGLAPPRGTGVRRGAARPSAPRANQPDRPSLPMTRRQAALATMGLRVCHGRSQQRHALRRSAGRRVAPRAPRSRPPHSHRDRRRDADKSARGQPRHAATSPTARSISAHFHWRKSVPHPVTEYGSSLSLFRSVSFGFRNSSRSALVPSHVRRTRFAQRAGRYPVARELLSVPANICFKVKPRLFFVRRHRGTFQNCGTRSLWTI